NGKAAQAPGKRRPDDDADEEAKPKKKQGGSGMLIAGIVLGGVAIIALAVGGVILFSSDSDEDKPSSRMSASAAAKSDAKPSEDKKDSGPTGPKPRQEDITNLLPNDTQVVLNLPLEYLLGNPRVNQALLKTPGAFQEGSFQQIWGIPPT